MKAGYWNDEREGELKKQLELGYSASQIAQNMHAPSRCSIIGKARRLGLVFKNPAGGGSSRPKNTQRPTPKSPRTHAERRPPQPRFPDLSVVTSDEPEVVTGIFPNRVSLLDATSDQCRWPAADDGSAMMVCGDPKYGSHPWCARHCRVAYEPRSPRRRTNKPVPFGRMLEAV
jgi:GcrA cell cycle regulator